MPREVRLWVLTVGAVVVMSGSGCVYRTLRSVLPPAVDPGPLWEQSDYRWRVRWSGNEAVLAPDEGLTIAADCSGGITAQAMDRDGFPIGPVAGAVLRQYRPGEAVQMGYEEGWLAETVRILEENGMDPAVLNLERLQEAGVRASDGRPFLLSAADAAAALAAGTLGYRSLQPELYDIPHTALQGWSLHYPPAPGLPDRLPEGLYRIWHARRGLGWLRVTPGHAEWGPGLER